MTRHNAKKTAAIALGALAVAGATGAATAVATGDGDASDTAITGSALTRASEAALAETGGGRVTGTEVGDEESYYEVEVTFTDGRQVDVQLDESFRAVSAQADHEDGQD